MDGDALIALFRQQADDAAGEELYSDETLLGFATEGEREACVRSKLLYFESGTYSQIDLVAGTATYALNPIIDRLDPDGLSLTLDSGGRPFPIELRGIDWIREHAHWETQTGRPRAAAVVDRVLRVFPIPTSASVGTLQLRGYRFPLEAINEGSDAPEIPVEHHEGLVDWMLYRAYSTKDGEAGDPARAADHLAAFTARFGERPSADTLRRHRERRRITTRYGGL